MQNALNISRQTGYLTFKRIAESIFTGPVKPDSNNGESLE